jgi:hypothetical protein
MSNCIKDLKRAFHISSIQKFSSDVTENFYQGKVLWEIIAALSKNYTKHVRNYGQNVDFSNLKQFAHTLNCCVIGPIFQRGAALVVCMVRAIHLKHTLLLRIPHYLMSCNSASGIANITSQECRLIWFLNTSVALLFAAVR